MHWIADGVDFEFRIRMVVVVMIIIMVLVVTIWLLKMEWIVSVIIEW